MITVYNNSNLEFICFAFKYVRKQLMQLLYYNFNDLNGKDSWIKLTNILLISMGILKRTNEKTGN